MSAVPKQDPPPLFEPPALGLDAETWDELPKPRLPRCEVCDRLLRAEKSQSAHVGPGCAAKVGRAVIANRAKKNPGRAS